MNASGRGSGQCRPYRRRVLKAFMRWGLLEAGARDEMPAWQHGGGLSLDAAVRSAADLSLPRTATV
ncbi:MAG: hypothetical protein P8Y27_06910, partial [Chromatiaceae bacterium]